VVLDRATLACSDQQALETALTHMWIEPDDRPLTVVGRAACGNVQVPLTGLYLHRCKAAQSGELPDQAAAADRAVVPRVAETL
jgi:hypothetical protein